MTNRYKMITTQPTNRHPSWSLSSFQVFSEQASLSCKSSSWVSGQIQSRLGTWQAASPINTTFLTHTDHIVPTDLYDIIHNKYGLLISNLFHLYLRHHHLTQHTKSTHNRIKSNHTNHTKTKTPKRQVAWRNKAQAFNNGMAVKKHLPKYLAQTTLLFASGWG